MATLEKSGHFRLSRRRLLFLVLTGLATARSTYALADNDDRSEGSGDGDHDDDDRDEALRSVRDGRNKPLSDILPTIRKNWPGEIIGVEIERKKSRMIYSIRVIANNGHLIEVEVDAATGVVLEVEND